MNRHNSRSRITMAVAVALLSALPAISARREPMQDQQPAAKQAKSASTKHAKAPDKQQSEGEIKFKQNCSRCHEAPQGFSPSISGTVLRHMRVRASLSEQDEQEILHFLNPK